MVAPCAISSARGHAATASAKPPHVSESVLKALLCFDKARRPARAPPSKVGSIMKKYLLTVAAILVSTPAFAQDSGAQDDSGTFTGPRGEIHAGYDDVFAK